MTESINPNQTTDDLTPYKIAMDAIEELRNTVARAGYVGHKSPENTVYQMNCVLGRTSLHEDPYFLNIQIYNTVIPRDSEGMPAVSPLVVFCDVHLDSDPMKAKPIFSPNCPRNLESAVLDVLGRYYDITE